MHPRHFDWCVVLLFVTFSLSLSLYLSISLLHSSWTASLPLARSFSLAVFNTLCVILFCFAFYSALYSMHSLLRSHLCLVLFHSFFRFFLSRIFILFFALTTRWRATNHLHRCMRSLTILNVLLNWFLDPKKNDAVVFRSAISILWILVFFWSATRIFPCLLQPVSFFYFWISMELNSVISLLFVVF